jgi:hypothetical protein
MTDSPYTRGEYYAYGVTNYRYIDILNVYIGNRLWLYPIDYAYIECISYRVRVGVCVVICVTMLAFQWRQV